MINNKRIVLFSNKNSQCLYFKKIKKYYKTINKIFISETDGPTTIDIGRIDNKEKKILLSLINII